MNKVFAVLFFVLVFVSSSPSQYHYSRWIHRNAADTTLTTCISDTSSILAFPPGCMGMGMMYPDSLYCQFENLPFDSLHHPFDSTFLCWKRIQLGSDSTMFTYLHCDSGYGNRNFMMGFQKGVVCRIHWDSTFLDSMHRGWHPTGIRCWDGSEWVTMPGVAVSGATISFATSQVYSAVAVAGAPGSATGVGNSGDLPQTFSLGQNYPNPFNPSTTIRYRVPEESMVTLTVYNLLGQPAGTLVGGAESAGYHEIQWSGSGMASGVYYYRIRAVSLSDPATTFSQVKGMILAK